MDFMWWEYILFGFIVSGGAVGLGVGFRKYKGMVGGTKKGPAGSYGKSSK